MAYARGRTIASAGNLFGEYTVDSGSAPAVGQPVMVRMQGIPTMPGYRDRPAKWNLEIWRAAWKRMRHRLAGA